MHNTIPNSVAGQVTLRDVIDSDLPIFYEHQLEPDAVQMAAFPARDRDAFFAHWNRIRSNPTVFNKPILLDEQVVGNIGSYEIEGEREIGYWLGKAYWGKGIATAALKQFLAQLTTRPLYAHVTKANAGSLRVLQKCGFVITGEDTNTFKEGEPVEEYVLELPA